MVIDTIGILTLASLTIVLGYIGNLFFEKTKIPDVLWLLLFGILVGPLLGLFDKNLFIAVSPVISAAALIVILFDAGLNMNIFQFIKEVPRATFITTLAVLSSTAVIAAASMALLGFDILRGLLLGAILSGSCTPTVLVIVEKLKIRSDIKTIIDLESVLNDPLSIVMFIAFLNMILYAETSFTKIIVDAFSIGIIVGIISGIFWLAILTKIQKIKFDYMLTLGVAILSYVIAESFGGSGVISALLFGIILGNSKIISRLVRIKENLGIEQNIRSFQSEITFFFSSFFFVLLGLVVSIETKYIIYGIVMSIILLATRYYMLSIGTLGMKLSKNELNIMRSLAPRGLTAAILAQLPLAFGIEGGEIFLNISFVVILVTIIYSVLWIKFKFKPEQ